jgi:cardiolipin synthase
MAAPPDADLTVPNFITIARLLSVPLIVWLMIADRFVEATLLFIIAGASDAADGFIAKRFGAASRLGAYLDPVADKALLVSVFGDRSGVTVFQPFLTTTVLAVAALTIASAAAYLVEWVRHMAGGPGDPKEGQG